MNMKRNVAGFLAMMMLTLIPAAFAEGGTVATAPETAEEVLAEATPEEIPEATQEETPAEEETNETDAAAEETVSDEALLAAISDNQRLDAAYTLALDAITKEDYETAKEYINICFAYCDAQSNPEMFSDLLLKRACIDVIEQKNDMALLNLDASLRVKPDLADAYLVKAQVYATQGDADRAIESLEKYIALTQDTSLYETVAQLQEAKGDIKAAEAAYDKFVEGAGAEVEEAGFQAGLYKMQSEEFEEAITAFEAYIENETYGAGALYNIGVCRMNMGDYAAAVEAFTQCEEKGGTFEGLYYNRGVCSLLCENWAGAAEDFTKSIETEPYAADARYNLGICQMQLENYEGAVATFTDYIGDGKQTPEGETTENADGTQEQTEVSSEANPDVNYGAYYYRAACRSAIGQLEEAIADYTVCIEQQYEPGQCYYQRAQIYAALGDTEKQNADLAESLKYSN